MNRAEFDHVVRAVADATGSDVVVVVGSQAVLVAAPTVPAAVQVSMELDVFVPGHPEASDVVDAVQGDGSVFHETFGYYAHAVGPETVVAPAHWLDRLVDVVIPVASGRPGHITARCIEVRDLVLAKLAAGRTKDVEFATWVLRGGPRRRRAAPATGRGRAGRRPFQRRGAARGGRRPLTEGVGLTTTPAGVEALAAHSPPPRRGELSSGASGRQAARASGPSVRARVPCSGTS